MTTRASAQKAAATRARQSNARDAWEARSETGVMLTAERVHQLRQARLRLEGALADRDKLIREAVAEGGGLREVAREVGLSHAGVKKIVERRMTAFSPESGGLRREAAAMDCPCIYCTHNAEQRCECQPCTFIRTTFGEDFHKEDR